MLLATAALLAALIGGRAALLSSSASDLWGKAVREQVKKAAATVEQIRYIYVDRAPLIFRTLGAEIRSDEFRNAAGRASGLVRSHLLVEAEANDALRESLLGAVEEAGDERYRTPAGGFDVGLLLADSFASYQDLLAIDPGATQLRGDRLSRQAGLEVAATIPVALAFLFGALAHGYPRRRRGLLLAGTGAMAIAVLAAVVIEATA